MNDHQQALAIDDDALMARATPFPPGYDERACRFCSKRIRWAILVDNYGDPVTRLREDGRTRVEVRVPLNPLPDPNGDLQLLPPGRVLKIPRSQVVMADQRYRSHRDTCKRAPRGKQARVWR